MRLSNLALFRPAAGLLLVGLTLAAPLRAQESPAARAGILRGTVELENRPIPGVPVVLHRVTSSSSGPVGETAANAQGTFEFRLPPPDTVADFTVYLASTEFQGVRYVGRAVHPADEVGEYRIEVFDTASSPPEEIRVGRRDMVLIPQPEGGWEVNEIVRLHNPNRVTRVAKGGLPTWEVRIPEGATDFEAGEGNAGEEQQVRRMEDRVLVMFPIVPGNREIFLRYRLPADESRTVLAMGSVTDTLNLFVRQPAPPLTVDGLTSASFVDVQGERLLRYAGTDLAADGRVRLSWQSTAAPVDPVVAAVVATVLLLGVGSVAAYQRGRRAA